MVTPQSGHASLIGSAFGGYEVQALVGRGAMGTVYLARDVALGRSVALKVLLGSLARNPAMVRSFYREAQAASPLRHPGIVRVYAAGIEGGTPFIAMEYVPGEPLDRFLRRKRQLSWQAALYIGGQVAEALHCAHDAGIVHRDIKPANILLDREGRVRLTDFGIARVCTLEQHGSDPKIIGTPRYMSLEQCAGEDVTLKTDLYSLGVTMYQMIAGTLPFQADSPQALMRLIASEPAPRLNRTMPDVPDDVARLVAHLLEKDPVQRPESARDVSQTIERLQAENGGRSAIPQALAAYVREQALDSPLRVLTPPPSKDRTKAARPDVRKTTTWNRRMLVAASLVVVTLACATGVSTWRALRSGPAATPASKIDSCTFTKQADGSVLAAVPAKAFHAYRIGWAGGENALLVEAVGDSTTMARGATGVLAFDPGRLECLNVSPPAGAALAEGPATAAAAPLALASGVRASNGTPAILLGQRNATSDKTFSGLLYVQRWNDAAPALNPAAAFTSATPIGGAVLDGDSRFIHAVLRPDGGAICMTLERGDGTNYLVEQKVYGSTPFNAITGNGPRILPESVQYAPAGDRLIYLRQDERGKQELWTTPVNGTASALLAIGYFNGETAISPSGDRIAAAWGNALGDAAELRIVDAADGTTLQRLGDATVGHDAWLPSGDGLIVAARGENGLRQLCLKTTGSFRDGQMLTAMENGVGNATAVSADGAWAAGVAQGESGVQIVFVDLSRVTRERTAARNPQPSTEQGRA